MKPQDSRIAQTARWGSLGLNVEEPLIMHIDLNSAFAMAEQQARPNLRGKPLGMTNRLSKYCCVIAASYEAKKRGVKVGMRLNEARALIPEFIILETDPPKYHYIYQKLAGIMKSYSPDVKMKSIDEGIIDFHGTKQHINKRSLEEIGIEIKGQLRRELGGWIKVNIGIGPNRFLAKTAASLNKPDGLDTIDHTNLLEVYGSLKLTDLTGIAKHYQARLNAYGIYTPIDFLNASSDKLRRTVFHSVVGEDWYQRLRGYEVDSVTTKLGQVGRQHVLDIKTNDESILLPRFHYLCETTGKKLRYRQVDARGILVWAYFKSGGRWHQRKTFESSFYTDKEIYRRALELFNKRPKHLIVTTLGITCYNLSPSSRAQASLMEEVNREEWLTEAIDDINERYGTFVISSLESLQGKTVKQKIPFGGTQYFELLLKRA
jgi:DNA polymerase-4